MRSLRIWELRPKISMLSPDLKPQIQVLNLIKIKVIENYCNLI